MKIVVDAYGSDKGESVMAEGCVLATNEDKTLTTVIVGDCDIINADLNVEETFLTLMGRMFKWKKDSRCNFYRSRDATKRRLWTRL